MRKILLIILLIVLLPAAVRAETRLMVVSDLHYLAPSLYRDSGVFLRALRGGDGKITQYGEELLSALYREIVSQQPDALAVTGDLTFNGEKESHIALASWFKAVEDAGVPVWIIPGNHDINVSSPVRFTADGYEPVTSEEFDVPPEKLDLNFSLVDKTTHPVAIAEKDPETGMYTLKFSKFMQVDTVTAETIGAEGLTDITITPALLSEGDAYADTFTVAGTRQGDAVRFNIKETALSYSGVSAEASTVIPRAILLGDVDGDEEITIIDALLIRRRIADIPTFAYHEDVADTDGDGAITIMDATFIQGWLADLPSNDAIGKPIKHD